MTEGLLTKYVEAGLPHLRKIAGLPEWLAPDVGKVAHELGDEGLLKLADPLGIPEDKDFLHRAPETNTVTAEIWQESLVKSQAVSQTLPIAMALLRVWEKARSLRRKGQLAVDPILFSRALTVLCYAPFIPSGNSILKRIAKILGGTEGNPPVLLDLFSKAVEEGDHHIWDKIEECIQEEASWGLWTEIFLEMAGAFNFVPRAIGVSPSLNRQLNQVLASMILEATDADNRRNCSN